MRFGLDAGMHSGPETKTGVFLWAGALIGATLAASAMAYHPGSFMMPACGITTGDARTTVTVTDGVQMLRAAAGLPSTCEMRDGADVYYMASCDMNGDGHMTVSDAVNQGEIYRFLAKNWTNDQLRKDIREAYTAGTAGRPGMGASAPRRGSIGGQALQS